MALMDKIAPDNLLEQAQKRYSELEKLAAELTASLKTAPSGLLRVSSRKNKDGGLSVQCYHITKKNDNNGSYIPPTQNYIARQLAQRDYNKKLLTELKTELASLKHFLKSYTPQRLSEVSSFFSAAKQTLFSPAVTDGQVYAQKWQSVQYKGKQFSEDAPQYYTDKNERVRSKSELIIANALSKAGIPYRYEFPLQLKNYGTVYPDFICLNLRTRREFIWEHFGMMDDKDYAEKAVKKINLYQANGYFPGDKLLVSMETGQSPLSTKTVQRLIEKYLI